MNFRIFLGVCLFFGGVILLASVFESIYLPLLKTLIYGMVSIVLIVVGILCLLWDTSADEFDF